ncbi:MAG: short-chain dehydrogenase, partial [Candidatus Tectomicrobia bacterium]|nr:short-chain dehydrogenase [Candidatus Tectomicrobia bacterium]
MALALTEAGADVAVAARRRERLEEAAAEIRSRGRRSAVVELDLTDPAEAA